MAAVDTPSPTSSSRSSSRRRPTINDHSSRSFIRMEPSPSRSLRTSPLDTGLADKTDETLDQPLTATTDGDKTPTSAVLPESFEDLPMEIISLTDRFLDGLAAKVYPSPLTIDQISALFQEFYEAASVHISSHVSSMYLALKSKSEQVTKEQQMLSFEEITQKRRDRRLLELKKLAIEEAVEKRVCEAIYDKLWRHKTSDDEARDDMLRSKIEALNLVGVRLTHLGVEDSPGDTVMLDALKESREAFRMMSEEKSPFGKLGVLRVIHKNIVDVLTTHSSSSHSSADQILPVLIYTLLNTGSPVTVVSDLYFIQRFRSKHRVDGEAAYCLTNLEATISFLETVDLATLHIDNASHPKNPSSQAAPAKTLSSVPPATTQVSQVSAISDGLTISNTSKPTERGITLLAPVEFIGNTIVQTTDQSLKLGSTVISTADQSLKTLGSAVENSYRFLFSRLQAQKDVDIPRTLEDARKLVDQAPVDANETDMSKLFDADAKVIRDDLLPHSDPKPAAPDLARKLSQQSLAESVSSLRRSARTQPGSTPSLLSDASAASKPSSSIPSRSHPSASIPNPAAAIANLGSSIGKFANFGIKGLARATGSGFSTPTNPSTPAQSAPAVNKELDATSRDKDLPKTPTTGSSTVQQADLLSTFPDLAGRLPELTSGASSVKSFPVAGTEEKPTVVERFMQLEVEDLKVGEVKLLLEEYRRLAEWVQNS